MKKLQCIQSFCDWPGAVQVNKREQYKSHRLIHQCTLIYINHKRCCQVTQWKIINSSVANSQDRSKVNAINENQEIPFKNQNKSKNERSMNSQNINMAIMQTQQMQISNEIQDLGNRMKENQYNDTFVIQ